MTNVPTKKGGDRVAARRISVIVVSYHTGPSLRLCLSALLVSPDVAEVIVVDNGNAPTEREYLDQMVQAGPPAVSVLRPGRNLGFARACNFGAERAGGDFIAIVNPDLEVAAGTFAEVVAALDSNPDAWLCGARLCNLDGSEQRGSRREVATPWRVLAEVLRLDRLFPNHPHFRRMHLCGTPVPSGVTDIATVSGAFMVFPRQHWQSLGGMDDAMFLHMEDADICLRILKAGGRVLFCGDAPVRHHLSTSDVPRVFVEWHKVRSGNYYFRKHFSQTYPDWALTLVGVALWARWVMLSIVNGPADLCWSWRRFRGDGARHTLPHSKNQAD